LNPKKPKEFIKLTADKLNVDEDLVNDITSFFWKDLRKALVDLKSPNIKVNGMGTFTIKDWKLKEVQDTYKRYLQRFGNQEDATFQRFAVIRDIQARLDKVENMQKMVDENLAKKKDKKIKRNEFETNMDTPKTDL
jgi:hypothetical protein